MVDKRKPYEKPAVISSVDFASASNRMSPEDYEKLKRRIRDKEAS